MKKVRSMDKILRGQPKNGFARESNRHDREPLIAGNGMAGVIGGEWTNIFLFFSTFARHGTSDRESRMDCGKYGYNVQG